MKCICIALLVLGVSISAFSQSKLFINKKNGTTDSMFLSDVKSFSFKSSFSPTPTPIPILKPVDRGSFQMGSISIGSKSDEAPVHNVFIELVPAMGFFIDSTEITYETWTEVRNWGLLNGYTDLPAGRNGSNGTTNHPVTEVSWYDAVKWCNARSEKDGFTPVYYTNNSGSTVYRKILYDLPHDAVKWTANGYRLPTEAEWEWAAIGGKQGQYLNFHGYMYSGSNNSDNVAWYENNSGNNTHPVATKGTNELDLYDMSGNVMEWCWDWYGPYSASNQADPKGPFFGINRMARGGHFASPAVGISSTSFIVPECRNTARFNVLPSARGEWLGFRCIRVPHY
jgi:formylglycine-generating enzyme required for sulfatase activity